ncbi:MAG: hypothetical protein IPL08_10495 [Saprospiraceae bacterium]|nr:hypothetical protein [Saprospiraceae bacterium]
MSLVHAAILQRGIAGSGLCGNSNSVTTNVIPTPDVNDQRDILMCNMTLVSPLPFTPAM